MQPDFTTGCEAAIVDVRAGRRCVLPGFATVITQDRHRRVRISWTADEAHAVWDPDGNDWEFVQYLSQNPAERNDYELPDS
jgi:hypothetical protein